MCVMRLIFRRNADKIAYTLKKRVGLIFRGSPVQSAQKGEDMIIKESISLNDKVNTAMLTYEHTGLLHKRIKRYRILTGIFFCIGASQIAAAFYLSMNTRFKCFTVAITIWSLYLFIFSRKRYTRHVKKWTKKNLKAVCTKYNVPQDGFEIFTEIKDDCIDSLVLGTKITYLKKDFVSYWQTPDYHVFEFTFGRFLYFKKSTFKDEEEFSAVSREITGDPAASGTAAVSCASAEAETHG